MFDTPVYCVEAMMMHGRISTIHSRILWGYYSVAIFWGHGYCLKHMAGSSSHNIFFAAGCLFADFKGLTSLLSKMIFFILKIQFLPYQDLKDTFWYFFLLLANNHLLLSATSCYLKILLANYYLLHGTCQLLLATWDFQLNPCYLLLVTCYLLLATSTLVGSTCNLQLATCN